MVPPGVVPPGTTELGIDIVKVEPHRAPPSSGSAAVRATGSSPTREQRYVRQRPETFAGRWAAKEAVSKVLGLGVRGVGWRDIEVERLPTGQPHVILHGRAAQRAEQLGMGRIAVSISHESDFAVAVAFGVRTAGGRYVFPLDIDERLDDRERKLLARLERLRELHEAIAGSWRPRSSRPRTTDVADRRPVGFGRREDDGGGARRGVGAAGRRRRARRRRRWRALVPERDKRGHKGTFGKLLVIAGSLDYAGAALLVCRAAGRAGAGLVTLAVPESLQPLFAAKVVEATTMALPEDDVEEVDPEPALATVLDHEHDALVIGPGCGRRWPRPTCCG